MKLTAASASSMYLGRCSDPRQSRSTSPLGESIVIAALEAMRRSLRSRFCGPYPRRSRGNGGPSDFGAGGVSEFPPYARLLLQLSQLRPQVALHCGSPAGAATQRQDRPAARILEGQGERRIKGKYRQKEPNDG